MNEREREVMAHAVAVVQHAVLGSLRRRSYGLVEYMDGLVARTEAAITRGELVRTKANTVRCSPITEKLARVMFDAAIELDADLPPGDLQVIPLGYARSISCTIGLSDPLDPR